MGLSWLNNGFICKDLNAPFKVDKSEGEYMIFLIKLLGILLGFAFPVFTIKAIKESLQGKSREQVYVVLSSVCGGAIMLIVMGLLPNT